MGDLNTQLRSFYEYIQETQEPVEMADIFDVGERVRPIAHPVDPPDRRWLRVGMIVAGAAAAVFTVLLIPIMLRSDAPPPIEEITEPTVTSTTVIEELAIQWIETQTTELVLPFVPAVAPRGVECPAPGATPPGGAGTTEGVWHSDTCYFLADSEVLFRSTDGAQWEAADTSDLLGSISINPEGFSSMRVVDEAGALDPSNCNVGDTDMEIGQSTDAESWTITKLPLERPSGESGCLETEWPHLAIGPAGTFVTVDIFYGLESQIVAGWWSPDGLQWSAAAREGPMRNGHISFVEAVSDGFIVESEGQFSEDAQEGIVWFTKDGATWTKRTNLGDSGEITPVEPVEAVAKIGTLVWGETDDHIGFESVTVNDDGSMTIETVATEKSEDGWTPIDVDTATDLIHRYVPDIPGFAVVADIFHGTISSGNSSVVPLRLEVGFDYSAIGIADFEEAAWIETPNGFEITDDNGSTHRIRIELQGNTADLIDESTGMTIGSIVGSEAFPIDVLVEMARTQGERSGGLLVSQDGVNWEFALPEWEHDFYWSQPVTAVPGGGYIVHVSTDPRLGPEQDYLFTSGDGLTWINTGEPQFLASIGNYNGVQIRRFADRLRATVVLRDSDSLGAREVWESEDGINWTPDAVLSNTAADVWTIEADFGWVAFGSVEPGTERVGIWVSSDGYEWTRLAVPDEYMAVTPGPSYYSFENGGFRLTILDHETGDLLSWTGHFES